MEPGVVTVSPLPYTNGNHQSPTQSIGGDSPLSPALSANEGLPMPKLSMMRESKSFIRPHFGRSTSVAFEGHNSVQDYLKILKNERFRHMPHDGSYWDRVLRWADNIGGVVLLSNGILKDFMLNSEDATRLICDSCTSLIRLGNNHIRVLLKAFSVFHQMAFALSIFLRQRHLIKSTPVVRRELAHAFQDFARFASDIKEYLTIRCLGIPFNDSVDYDTVVALGTASFYDHLEKVSISMWTSGKNCASYNLHKIRAFLGPQDSVVKTIMSNRLYSESKRAEFTCDWFAPRLRKFTKDTTGNKKVFLITGEPCTGKSVLSRWIQEKLQESVDDEPYDVIAYSVDTSVKHTTSPLSLIKSLLLQLLDRKIGREGLLSRITKAMDHAREGCPASEIEATLWSAFEASIDERKLLILIDGLDQLSGPRSGNPPVLDTLSKITKSRKNVKAIVLSRPLGKAAQNHCQEYLSLENIPETSNDIRHYVEDFIQHCPDLRRLKESEKSEIIQKYAQAANRSFLWAELQLQSIKHEDSASSILKACEKAPKAVEECVDQLIGRLDVKRADTKRILSWVLAAERPLSLKEVKSLIEVDLDSCAYRPFSGDVEKLVRQLGGHLLVIQDNLVHLRHPSIRERLVSTTSKKNSPLAINIQNAHEELASRSMAYVRIHLLHHEDLNPREDLCDSKEMARSFGQHALLEYAVRYWVLHFSSSSLYDKSTNKVSFSDRFRMSFASSVRLALYEGSCLARQYIAAEAESYQNLALTIRKSLSQNNSAALLQSLLMEIRIGRGFKDAHVLAGYSYEAYKLGVHVCSRVTVKALAEAFISYSASLKVTEHTELIEEKVEVLQYLIEWYEHEHIESKQIVYLGYLAQLYVDIEEVQKAVIIYRKLYRLRLGKSGHLHEETHSLFHLLVSYLKQLSFYDEVLEVTLEYHEYIEQTLSITDQRRIDSTLIVVQIYEERKEYFRAEQTLVRFWKCVSSAKASTRITELRVEFALKYCDFLHRYSRREECEIILRGIWTEIQSYSHEYRFQSTMITRVEKIAHFFSKLEIFSMSRSIYQSLYEYYESREERTSTECITIVRSLAETITKSYSYSKTVSSSTSTTTTTSTTVISKEEKSTLLEIFESSLETTEISSTTIAICQALCSSYIYEEKYEEACEIYLKVINKVWASITSVSVSIDITEITEHLTVEILDLCISFAECHFKMLHIEIAETIYINIFRALICIRHIDKCIILAKIKLIIAFFELTYKFERVIEIYRELFIWMPICFGKSHSETITILMAFARICFRLRLYEEASTACFFIYTCFRTTHGCLHLDGFAAAILLAEIYEIQCKWHLAYEVYGYLWRTFVDYGAEYKIEAVTIQKIYERYIFILEHRESCDINVLIQISKEYHDHCVSIFKHHHEVSIKATLAYAHYCERVEEHHELSVSLYQQVIKFCKTTKTEFSKKTLHICNTRVAKLYASSSKEITKAVEIYHEEFESCKKTSKTSTETMTALHSFVSTCRKQSTTESITKATETLKSSVLEIFKEESSTETLVTSARSIAKTYKECSFTEEAKSLIVEMRSKIVEEVRTSVTSRTECSHSSYTFLASFQEAMSESCSFSSAMAEIREEVMLYESYFSEVAKSQTDYRSIIKSGSSLYFHLHHKKECHSEFIKIKKELTEYFCKYLTISQTIRASVMDHFFHLYLKHISHIHYEQEVVRHAEEHVFRHTKAGEFVEAYELVLLIDRFIHLHSGFHSEFYITVGLNLAKYLVGVGTKKCKDEKLYASMFSLSLQILQESLKGLDKIDMELYELQQLLADLIGVLSEQKKYTDLERILQVLWDSRKVRNNLSSSPLVLYIGRSLIQVLACLNKFSDAIHLCYHIRYNLAYIRGALDKSTVEFTVLLSELYTQQNRYHEAVELHEDILYRLGEGQSAPGLDAVRVASNQIELLKIAYKREGGEKPPSNSYDLFKALDNRFNNNQAWKETRPQLEKWTPGTKEGETFGCWKKPAKFQWQFEDEETHVESDWREELVTRRVSGKYWGQGVENGSFGDGTGNGRIYASDDKPQADGNGNEGARDLGVD